MKLYDLRYKAVMICTYYRSFIGTEFVFIYNLFIRKFKFEVSSGNVEFATEAAAITTSEHNL